MKLMMVSHSDDTESSVSSRYNLVDLQSVILQYGAGHFSKKKNIAWTYFQVLLLSAQFERAIDYLLKSDVHNVEAIHYAIALAYFGLLRTTSVKDGARNGQYRKSQHSVFAIFRLLVPVRQR